MELRDLRSLVEVVRQRSFTAAAATLGYTQSAISQQVAALETELGTLLVQRRPVLPTAAGLRLVEHAERILLRIDVARSEIATLRADDESVAVAVTPLTAPRVLADALRRLRMARPNISALVRAIEPAGAIAEVATGSVQAALVDGIATPNEPLELADAGLLTSTRIAEVPLGVVFATGHPLLHQESVDLESLADAPWVASPRLLNDAGRLADLESRHRKSRVVYEGLDVATLLSLVEASMGAALLPGTTTYASHDVEWRPLRNSPLVHRTELVTLRATSRLATELAVAFRESAA